MTVLFSHPNVNGASVATLGLLGKADTWRPQSAFFEEDWSLRPVGHAFNELGYKTTVVRTRSVDFHGEPNGRGRGPRGSAVPTM